MDDLTNAKIKAIYLHPTQKVPVVFLTTESEDVVLPMVVGFLEAQAILTAWQGLTPPRPVTIDLLHRMIEDDFGAQLDKVVITDLREGAYIAALTIQHNENRFDRDARPSDALALAVRTAAPIYFSQQVIEKAKGEQENARAMLEFLEAESKDTDDIIKF